VEMVGKIHLCLRLIYPGHGVICFWKVRKEIQNAARCVDVP
jgi:hypothetical protein